MIDMEIRRIAANTSTVKLMENCANLFNSKGLLYETDICGELSGHLITVQ